MCISRPIFRVGTTLKLDGEDTSGKVPGRWNSLSRDHAVEIGRALLRENAGVADHITKALKACAQGFAEVAIDRAKDARLDFTHGVIVDFSNMVFESDRFLHRVRVCITVCQHGNLSKVWFRSQCVGRRDDPDQDFTAPVHFQRADLTDFFEETRTMGDAACTATIVAYNDVLQRFADTNYPGWTLQQHRQKPHRFYGFDSDNHDVETLFDDLREGHSFSREIEHRMTELGGVVHPAMIALDLVHPQGSAGADTLANLRDDDTPYTVYDPHSVYGDIGIFVQRRETSAAGEPEFDEYAGVAYDPRASQADDNYNLSESPIYRVTAEMLAYAVES